MLPVDHADYPPELVAPLREALANELRKLGTILSPEVHDAFCTVSRHLFLPSYYEQQGTSLSWQQRHAPAPTSDPALLHEWLQAIYTNRPLTTLVDEEGVPISSSSMPSVMATMLEALRIEPGMHVLEIGTGTGYNAALLAYLVGSNGHVTTIDLNAHLVERARIPLSRQAGPIVSAVAGDGTGGWRDHAPYHRIIATGRSTRMWDAWLDQLAPGGRLVLDLGGALAGGLFVAAFSMDCRRLEGRFLSINVSFMRLQSASDAPPLSQDKPTLVQASPTHVSPLEGDFSPLLFKERSWRFFLQWHLPAVTLQWWGEDPEHVYPSLFDAETQTILRFQQAVDDAAKGWFVHISGQDSLWERVQQTFQAWQQLGCPDLDSYRLVIEREGAVYSKRLAIVSQHHTYVMDVPFL